MLLVKELLILAPILQQIPSDVPSKRKGDVSTETNSGIFSCLHFHTKVPIHLRLSC